MEEQGLTFPKLFPMFTFSQKEKSKNASLTSSPFSFQPSKYKNQNDIPLDIIYTAMIDKYMKYPLLKRSPSLRETLSSHRTRLIAKMKEFIQSYHLSSSIIFKAIYYFDRLINSYPDITMDDMGIGALILAIKFNELEIKSPRIKRFQFFFDSCNFTIDELLRIEVKALKQLNYILDYIQPLHFLQFVILNGIVFNIDKKAAVNGVINSRIYLLPFHILEIAMENADYMEFHPLYLACACVALAREMNHLDKWNALLENTFNLKLSVLESEYFFVKRCYDSKQTSVKPPHSKEDNDLNDINARAEVLSPKHRTNQEVKSQYAQFKSRSVGKSKKELNSLISNSIKIMNDIINDSKILKEDGSFAFNIAEMKHNKNRNVKSNSCNETKTTNLSHALHLSQAKDERKQLHLPRFSKKMKNDSFVEKHRNRFMNGKISYCQVMKKSSNVFSNLFQLNNMNNFKKKTVKNLKGLNVANFQKATKSLEKPFTNNPDQSTSNSKSSFKRKTTLKLAKNSSCKQ